MKFYTCLFLCLSTPTAISQPITDSLRNAIFKSGVKDTSRLQHLHSRLAYQFYLERRYDSSLAHYLSARALERKERDPELNAHIYFGTGVVYSVLGRYDSSIQFYKEAINRFKEQRDTTNWVLTETNLSAAYKNIGLYQEALQSSLQILSVSGSRPSLQVGSIHNNIGNILLRTGDRKGSERSYRTSLAILTALNSPAETARVYNNLGELFIITRDYDSARQNLSHAARIKRQLGDLQGLARTINNLGRVAMLEGDLRQAERHFEEALTLEQQVDDPIGMVEVLHNLAELNIAGSRLNEARRALHTAAELIRRAGTPEYLRRNLELQIKVDRALNDLSQSILHLEELLVVRDSLLNEEKARSLMAMQIRYETQKKEQEIRLLQQREEIHQAQLRTNRILIVSLSTGLILVVLIGLLVYLNFRNTRAAKRRIELLLADQRHRIKNNLQTLASIFNLQTYQFTDSNMILEARNSESRVHTMALLHDRFYANNAGSVVPMQTFINDLAQQLVDIYGFRTENISLRVNVTELSLDIDKATAVGLILQELVCNSFKYAFAGISHPQLGIDLSIERKHDIEMSVSDNGIGLAEVSAKESRGLELVYALVEQLNGKFEVIRGKGTTFKLVFPMVSKWKRH